jgi:hypothetical protein
MSNELCGVTSRFRAFPARSRQRLVVTLLWCLASACADSADRKVTDYAGRYEPSQLPDSGPRDAGYIPCTRNDTLQDDGDNPAGMLHLAFTVTVAPGVVGHWDKMYGGSLNSGAIWIEDEAGALVKTVQWWGPGPFSLDRLARYTSRYLCNVDVIATPTQMSYQLHDLMWDGMSTHGKAVKDGNYTLLMDIQIDEDHPMDVTTIPFVKGRAPFMMQPPDLPPHTGLTIDYEPK